MQYNHHHFKNSDLQLYSNKAISLSFLSMLIGCCFVLSFAALFTGITLYIMIYLNILKQKQSD